MQLHEEAPDRPHEPVPGEEPALWTYRDVLQVFLFAVSSMIVLGGLWVAAMIAWETVTGSRIAPGFTAGRAVVALAIQVVWWALVLAFVYFIVTVRRGRSFLDAMGWKPLEGPPMAYVAGGFLLVVSMGLLANLVGTPETTPFEEMLKDRTVLILFGLFGVLVAPLVEELLFRGFLFPVLENTGGPALAVIGTSGLFSLVHAQQYGWSWQILLILFYVGSVFGIVRWKTGSVKATTLLHASYNGILVAGLLLGGRTGAD
jgi:uncharacterized protein